MLNITLPFFVWLFGTIGIAAAFAIPAYLYGRATAEDAIRRKWLSGDWGTPTAPNVNLTNPAINADEYLKKHEDQSVRPIIPGFPTYWERQMMAKEPCKKTVTGEHEWLETTSIPDIELGQTRFICAMCNAVKVGPTIPTPTNNKSNN